ncbi:MAG: CDP-diacylglycerol--serine O-phosphatidyltransferase [Verrucomicrobiota bacterium]
MNETQNDSPKIYLLPNLMTAGNLFCGFAASLQILKGTLALEMGKTQISYFNQTYFHLAIWLILAACIFDMLDGRLARLGGHESEFGREFDSLADVISFGVAPALLLYKIVLQDFEQGWVVAFLYLLCGALRLARFNCMAAKGGGADKDFRGFPIPAAAGVIASVTLFVLWYEQPDRELGHWKYLLPSVMKYGLLALMIFLSFMMFSKFKYPSFKALNWRTKGSIPRFIFIFLLLIFTALEYTWMPAVIFICYLLYGFLRPFLSLRMRHEIEDPEEDEDASPGE